MKKSFFQEFKNQSLQDQIGIVLIAIVGVHAVAFLFIILCWFVQAAFYLSTAFWKLFYNFIASGLSFEGLL